MKLTAPINILRRKARLLSREQGIPLHEALDRIAALEGASSWSLLVHQISVQTNAQRLYACIEPGDLVLIGARPGQGKTLLSLQVLVEAMARGNRGFFFSLEYTESECRERFEKLGIDLTRHQQNFVFDGSDDICASHIVQKLSNERAGTIAVIDYLQLLDQKRTNASLSDQLQEIHRFAKTSAISFIFISQIDRRYDPKLKPCPDFDDIRLPNPLDLSLFDMACFVHGDEVRLQRMKAAV